MKKKGFTLIELLAIIVLLAIVSLISIPTIIDVTKKSRKSTFESSANEIVKTIELRLAEDLLVGTIMEKTYVFPTDELDFEGEQPNGGELTVNEQGEIAIAIYNGEYCALKSRKENTVRIIEYDEKSCVLVNGDVKVNYENYAAGLYETGTTNLIYSWEDLLAEGIVTVTDGLVDSQYNYGAENPSSEILSGHLVFPNDGSATGFEMWAFRFCKELTGITIPDSFTSLSFGTFQGCTSLTDINIGSGITTISTYVFNGCTSPVDLVLPDTVTTINKEAFYGFSGLRSIVLPESITSIGNTAFQGCTNLTSITIPSKVTEISQSCFQNCTSLKEINYSNNLTEIGFMSFYGNDELTSFHINSGVNTLDSRAFDNCNNLTEFTVSEDNETFTEIDGIIYSKDLSTLIRYPHGRTGHYTVPEHVTTIDSSAFYWGAKVTSIDVHGGIEAIEGWTFRDIEFTTVTLKEGITTIGEYAFYGGQISESLIIPKSVTTIEKKAFEYTELSNVYYTGTEEEWAAITVGSDNENLTSANITYNYVIE